MKIEIENELLTKLHDKMADVLCFIDGVEKGVLCLQTGNKESRQAVLSICNVVSELKQVKQEVRRLLK